MAWKCGFHNSVDDDRTYNAADMSSIYDGLITDGIFPEYEDELKVSAGTGMKVIIATGKGWFNSRYGSNTTDYELELEASDPLLNRWAAIIVRGDNSDSVRDTYPTIIYSEFASEPTKPSLTREDYVYDYCLAYVYIKAGATAISDEDITDTRDDEDLCGYSAALFNNFKILQAYPVGSTIIRFDDVEPAEIIGGSWTLVAQDRMLIGAGNTYALGDTGGEATHTLTEDELAKHLHSLVGRTFGWGDTTWNVHPKAGSEYVMMYTGTIGSVGNAMCSNQGTVGVDDTGNTLYTGSDSAHNNLSPYEAVYFWKRIA